MFGAPCNVDFIRAFTSTKIIVNPISYAKLVLRLIKGIVEFFTYISGIVAFPSVCTDVFCIPLRLFESISTINAKLDRRHQFRQTYNVEAYILHNGLRVFCVATTIFELIGDILELI